MCGDCYDRPAQLDALYQAWCQAETKQKQRELLAEHYERETRNALAIAWWRHASGFSPEGGTPDTRLNLFSLSPGVRGGG